MKNTVLKLTIGGLLTAMTVVIASQVLPVVTQGDAPPPEHQFRGLAPPPGIRHLEKVEDLVLEMTNQIRVKRGLKPLIKDAELTLVARANSDDMLVRRFFDHTDPDGVAFYERIAQRYRHRVFLIGENIWDSEGFDPDKSRQVAQEMMDSWLTSPGHRENLLDPEYTHLGVGVSARQDRIRATQEFVKRPKYLIFGSGD
jgi:uncharacterized protein YkwD